MRFTLSQKIDKEFLLPRDPAFVLITLLVEQLGIEPKLVVCKTTVLTIITITPCLFNLSREGHIWVFSYSHDRPIICLFNYPGSQNRTRTCDPLVMVLDKRFELLIQRFLAFVILPLNVI